MGWGLKIGLLFFALIAAYFGSWIITVPILALLFIPPLMNKRDGRRATASATPSKGSRVQMLDVIGFLMVLLSVVAFFSGGVFSPIVLAGIGVAVVLRHRFSVRAPAGARPVTDSILLRSKLNPLSWNAIAEVKVSTKNLEGALSGLNERILCVSDPTPRIFLLLAASSFRRAAAEEVLMKRMQATARQLTPLGAYLLPLASEEAAGVATVRASGIEPPTENLRQFISTADYGTVLVEAERGFVTGLEFYARPDAALKARSVLSDPRRRSAGQLTLREFLHEALQRTGRPQPDRYVAFLSSMAATEGELLGQRITETTQGRREQVLLVASVGSPQVELTRAQLRAISTIYE
jgi:hypothetical protein